MATPERIKLIISDLHLGKGQILPNGSVNPLEEFYHPERFAEFIAHYSSKEFRNTQVELILNGDTFNLLQCDYKGHYLTVLTEAICVEMFRAIIAGHPKVFDALKAFASHAKNQITFIVGNRDQAMLWPAMRALFDERLQTSVRYKNLVYFFDGYHVEHGHMQEILHRYDPKRFFLKKNLPEPILNLPFGSHFFVDFVLPMKRDYPQVDRIRPFSKVFRWALFNEPWLAWKTLMALMAYLFRTVFIKDERHQWTAGNILMFLWRGIRQETLVNRARSLLGEDLAHTVIFGHSHVYHYR